MKKMILITVLCAFITAPAMADPIWFADELKGVDNTTGWSAGDGMTTLTHSQSLLGGNATVYAYNNGSDGTLTHRLTRGLGVDGGGDNDEVDRVAGVEHIDIAFNTPYALNYVEVRSLFDNDNIGNVERARIDLFYTGGSATYADDLSYGAADATHFLEGTEALSAGGDGIASLSIDTVLVDYIVFRVPTAGDAAAWGQFDAAYNEFAVAKIVPVPAAALLGLLGLGTAGLRLRKRS